jgi:hypothetical protein
MADLMTTTCILVATAYWPAGVMVLSEVGTRSPHHGLKE